MIWHPWKVSAPWLLHYPKNVPPRLCYPEGPVWRLLEQAAQSHEGRVACCYYDQQQTYGQLFQTARGVSALLKQRGTNPGDRVAVLLSNCPEYLASVYGIWMAGGVVVALSPLMVAEEISDLMISTGSRSIITLDLMAHLITPNEHIPRDVYLATLRDRMPMWQRLGYQLMSVRQRASRARLRRRANVFSFYDELARIEPDPEPVNATAGASAYILPTGGTTGAPKAVVLTHRNLVANAWQLAHWAGNSTGRESILAVLPFFHSYGLSTCVTAGVAMAATLVLHHRFRTRRVIELIERHRPTIFPAVPAMLVALNERLRRRPADLSSLASCMSGGSALDPDVGREFSEHSGATVVEGYGLSEASPVTHVGPLDGNARPGTIGLPLPDTEARIVDMETGQRNLLPGEVGELIVRGPQVMAGYWNDPGETARVLRRGWLYTGDLASCDQDGFFRIVDRKKDLIIASGFNVQPSDVEHVIRQFPGVADCAVVGVPDRACGELVKAYLVLDSKQRFRRREFDTFIGQHLAKHKRPKLVEIVRGDLPRNFLGKVLRRRLRDETGKQRVPESPTDPRLRSSLT